MRGGYLHNEIMVASLDYELSRLGFETSREAHVKWQGGSGFIDLLAESPVMTLSIEIERSTHRIQRDLLKAAAIQARELWIVVPDRRVRNAIDHVLERLHIRSRNTGIFVFTYGQALQRVGDCFSHFSVSNEPEKQSTNPERKSRCTSSGST